MTQVLQGFVAGNNNDIQVFLLQQIKHCLKVDNRTGAPVYLCIHDLGTTRRQAVIQF